ncbi:unnamed protein product [Camellia sinensis]
MRRRRSNKKEKGRESICEAQTLSIEVELEPAKSISNLRSRTCEKSIEVESIEVESREVESQTSFLEHRFVIDRLGFVFVSYATWVVILCDYEPFERLSESLDQIYDLNSESRLGDRLAPLSP